MSCMTGTIFLRVIMTGSLGVWVACPRLMSNKTIIRFTFFCDIQINQYPYLDLDYFGYHKDLIVKLKIRRH